MNAPYTTTACIRFLPQNIGAGVCPYLVDLFKMDVHFSTTSFDTYKAAAEFCERSKFTLKPTMATIEECQKGVNCSVDHFTVTLWHGETVQKHKYFGTYEAARDWIKDDGYGFDPTPTMSYLGGKAFPKIARAHSSVSTNPEAEAEAEQAGIQYDEARIFICITEKTRVINDHECVRGYSVIIDLQPNFDSLPPASLVGALAPLLRETIDAALHLVCGQFDRKYVHAANEDPPPLEKGLDVLLEDLNGVKFPEHLDPEPAADPPADASHLIEVTAAPLGMGGQSPVVDEFADLVSSDLEATTD